MIFRGLGDAEFADPIIFVATTGLTWIRSADFDADNDDDLMTGNQYEDTVTYFENLGGGFFAKPVFVDVPNEMRRRVAVIDIDLDGDPDLVGLSGRAAIIAINEGHATFAYGGYYWLGGEFSGIAVADLDRNNTPDILAACTGYTPLLSSTLSLVPPRGICPADLNADGLLDLADLIEFISAFSTSDPKADINGDGLFDLDDITEFLTVFSSGCP